MCQRSVEAVRAESVRVVETFFKGQGGPLAVEADTFKLWLHIYMRDRPGQVDRNVALDHFYTERLRVARDERQDYLIKLSEEIRERYNERFPKITCIPCGSSTHPSCVRDDPDGVS